MYGGVVSGRHEIRAIDMDRLLTVFEEREGL